MIVTRYFPKLNGEAVRSQQGSRAADEFYWDEAVAGSSLDLNGCFALDSSRRVLGQSFRPSRNSASVD